MEIAPNALGQKRNIFFEKELRCFLPWLGLGNEEEGRVRQRPTITFCQNSTYHRTQPFCGLGEGDAKKNKMSDWPMKMLAQPASERHNALFNGIGDRRGTFVLSLEKASERRQEEKADRKTAKVD